jgi:nitroreductase
VEFLDVVRRRRMTRNYDASRPVGRETLDRVLDCGLRAPSAGFSQGWAFVVLDTPEGVARFWSLVNDPEEPAPGTRHAGMRQAPVVVLPLSDKAAYLARYAEPDKAGFGLEVEDTWPVPYWDIDTAFAVMAMLLAATNEGLGALFFGIFRGERDLLDDLGVPTGLRPIGALLLGYPAENDHRSPSLARGRRPAESVVRFGRWDAPGGATLAP